MKLTLFIMIAIFLMSTGVFAQEPDSSRLAGIQEELGQIRRQMDDLVKSEAALRDRQTTRMMRLEEDFESLRLELGRKISETEIMLSQEQSLLREYIEIINKNIRELKVNMDGYDENLKDLDEGLSSIEQNLTGIRAGQKQTDEKITAVENNISATEGKITAVSSRISDLTARLEKDLSRIDEIQAVEQRVSDIAGNISNIESEFDELVSMVQQELEVHINTVEEIEKSIREEIAGLSEKISFTDQGVVERIRAAESRISLLNEHINEREILAAAAILSLGLLILMTFFMAVSSRRKATRFNRKLEQKNSELNHKIEEQGAALDTRLVELLEKQLFAMSQEDTKTPHSDSPDSGHVTDHSLAIILGEEIYRIMKRNRDLSEKSQVFDELKESLRRLWTAFREKGYELIDLQDKKYHKGMEARAEFFLTHELLPGEQIVSRVIKPLIKYKGVTIQEAEIEVLVGE